MEPRPLVSAILVSYNSGRQLAEAQKSFEAAFAGLPIETLVVDNASGEPWFPTGAIAVRSERNRGFGGGCNLGAAQARAPVLLFLNPDARLAGGPWRELVEVLLNDSRAGALGVRRRDPSGNSLREIIPPPMTLGQIMRDIMAAGTQSARVPKPREEVAWLPGSCLFVKTEAFKTVGGFDETFFLYFEDVDLCNRLRRAGYHVIYFDAAEAIHPEAGHDKYHDRRRIANYFSGLATYVSKWHPSALFLARGLVLLRLATRAIFWTAARALGRVDSAVYRERLAGYREAARVILSMKAAR